MSLKIIFPPFAEHALNGPFLAPFLLATILEKEGITSEAIDLNIRFIRKITKPDIIQKILSENIAVSHDSIVLTHFTSIQINEYTKYSTDGLVYVLQILRKILIPEFNDFNSCLSSDIEYNSIIKNIYFELITELKLEKTDIVGFSIPFAEQLHETLFIAGIIKNLHPDVKMIVGGSQINLLNENQLKSLKNTKIFTVIAKGDGETGISNLIRNISNFENSTLVQFPPVNQKLLDEIPFTTFIETSQYLGKLVLPVLVTKGCYWGKCSFCDYIKLSDLSGNSFIARKPETVLDEIKKLEKENQNTTFFLISDAIPPLWYKKLCKLAIVTGFKLKTWSYLIHSDLFDRDFFEKMSEAGVKAITFGTENLNNRLLNVLKKNFSKEIILKNLHDASDLKFSVTVNIIPDIPSATYDESIEVLMELQDLKSHFDVLNIQPFVLTSDTLISKNPEKYGIEILCSVGIKSNHGFQSLNFIDLNGMSDEKRKNVLKAFLELSVKIKIQKRTKFFLQNEILNETVLCFDPTACIIEGEIPELFIGSLKTGFAVKKWEIEFYSKVLLFHDLKLTFSNLQELYCKFSLHSKSSFSKYFITILKRGIIVKIS